MSIRTTKVLLLLLLLLAGYIRVVARAFLSRLSDGRVHAVRDFQPVPNSLIRELIRDKGLEALGSA